MRVVVADAGRLACALRRALLCSSRGRPSLTRPPPSPGHVRRPDPALFSPALPLPLPPPAALSPPPPLPPPPPPPLFPLLPSPLLLPSPPSSPPPLPSPFPPPLLPPSSPPPPPLSAPPLPPPAQPRRSAASPNRSAATHSERHHQGPQRSPDGQPRQPRAIVAALPYLLDFLVPLTAFYALTAAGLSSFWSLTIGGALTGVISVVVAIRRGKLDGLGLLVIAEIALGLALIAITRDPRLVLRAARCTWRWPGSGCWPARPSGARSRSTPARRSRPGATARAESRRSTGWRRIPRRSCAFTGGFRPSGAGCSCSTRWCGWSIIYSTSVSRAVSISEIPGIVAIGICLLASGRRPAAGGARHRADQAGGRECRAQSGVAGRAMGVPSPIRGSRGAWQSARSAKLSSPARHGTPAGVRPADLLLAVLSLLIVAAVLGSIRALPLGSTEAADDVSRWLLHIPRWLSYAAAVVAGVASFVLVVVSLVVLLRNRWRDALNAVAAGAVAPRRPSSRPSSGGSRTPRWNTRCCTEAPCSTSVVDVCVRRCSWWKLSRSRASAVGAGGRATPGSLCRSGGQRCGRLQLKRPAGQ